MRANELFPNSCPNCPIPALLETLSNDAAGATKAKLWGRLYTQFRENVPLAMQQPTTWNGGYEGTYPQCCVMELKGVTHWQDPFGRAMELTDIHTKLGVGPEARIALEALGRGYAIDPIAPESGA